MFLSLYPTDSEETREGVVDAARALGAEVFTSLHILRATTWPPTARTWPTCTGGRD